MTESVGIGDLNNDNRAGSVLLHPCTFIHCSFPSLSVVCYPLRIWFYDQWWLLIPRTSKTPDQLFNIYLIGLSRHVGVHTDKDIVVIVSPMCNNSISQLYSILPLRFLISLVHRKSSIQADIYGSVYQSPTTGGVMRFNNNGEMACRFKPYCLNIRKPCQFLVALLPIIHLWHQPPFNR